MSKDRKQEPENLISSVRENEEDHSWHIKAIKTKVRRINIHLTVGAEKTQKSLWAEIYTDKERCLR
jgi:hypothetical protein